MLVLTYKLRAAAAGPLARAVEESERRQEIAITVRAAKDLAALTRDLPVASLIVIDLEGLPAQQALTFVARQLEEHPFAKVICVPTEQSKLTDQVCFFHFGRVGIRSMPLPQETFNQDWWIATLADTAGFDVVAQAHRELQALVPSTARGILALRVAQHATAASVKVLADRMYPGTGMTLAYKRRKLWEECRALGAGTPENVLDAVRLALMKTILDANVWTHDRVARYFGYHSVRNMSRSCKTRYGRSINAIRHAPRSELFQFATGVFFDHNTSAEP